jgi:hypothetical protein
MFRGWNFSFFFLEMKIPFAQDSSESALNE